MTLVASALRHKLIVIGLLGAVAAAGLALAPTRSHADAPPPAAAPPDLQRERTGTLRQASDIVHKMFAQGMSNIGEVSRIDRSLLEAELESASSAQDRRQILEGALEMAKKQEQLTVQQHQVGTTSPLAPLEAKAYRLQIEIELSKSTAK
jgi:outer membrane protein TolC